MILFSNDQMNTVEYKYLVEWIVSCKKDSTATGIKDGSQLSGIDGKYNKENKMKKRLILVAMLVVCAVGAQAAVVKWAGTHFDGSADYADGSSWTIDGFSTSYGSMPQSADSHGLIGSWASTEMPTISSAIMQAPSTLGIGWDNFYGELNLVDGGSIYAKKVILGYNGTVASVGVLNISGGLMVVGEELKLGGDNGALATSGTINQTGGILHLAAAPVFNNGVINLSDTAVFKINGDQTALDLVGNGFVQASVAGQSVVESYNSGSNLTEYTVIPEPATLGLFALSSVGILWFRKYLIA